MVRWIDNFLDDIKIAHPKKITFYQVNMAMKLMDKGYGQREDYLYKETIL
jgi:hypothetical protein